MGTNYFKNILTDSTLMPTWWISNLDWIFDDKKFEKSRGWTKGPRRILTNYINKSISSVSIIKKGNKIVSPKGCMYAIFTSDECACVSFMRHIRNSIAHNNATIIISKKQKFIRFTDYSNNSRDVQTADIMISMDFLIKLQQKYISAKTTPVKCIHNTDLAA